MTAEPGQRKHPRYPLRTSVSLRHLEDQDGTPAFVNGDTAWSMVVSLLPNEWEQYLADREAGVHRSGPGAQQHSLYEQRSRACHLDASLSSLCGGCHETPLDRPSASSLVGPIPAGAWW